MPLLPGTRLGVYEITAPLGAGGMGEVYRARDSRLKRDVAIKVLPPEVAADRERLARFQREAEVLASLNHPHIAHVYGIEDNALVMELVEGEDLSQRIARGAIPLDEALPIAKQIAEALEAAHDAGIVHRDLKPANVKVRADGTVKVLDFGLAKAASEPKGSHDLANSPTITSPAMTMHGVILGTAAYMSPEQAKGRAVDRRADIWAFGCVLYEMLTGKRAFKGDDVTDIITSVMRDTPDWSALPQTTPQGIRKLLQQCLEKDPRRRTPHIAVARIDIDSAINGPPHDASVDVATQPRRGGRLVAAALVAAAIFALGGWAIGRYSAPPPPPSTSVRFTVDGPFATPFSARATAFVAVAPDGTRMAYIAQPRGNPRQLFLHSLIDDTTRALPNTEDTLSAFWSPDGSSIAFSTGERLQRIDVATGAVQTVCGECTPGLPGTWNQDGVILFGAGTIQRVPAAGGAPVAITTLDPANGEIRHERPSFLPDGRHFIFTVINENPEKSALRYGELGSTEIRELGNIGSGADYVRPGYLIFAKDAKLMARPFDAAIGEWRGEAIVVADSIRQQSVGTAAFSASPNGVIAFDPVAIFEQQLEVAWVDRLGKTLSTFVRSSGGHAIALAPNGLVAALEQNGIIWVVDGERGTRTRLTLDKSTNGHPVWSPDGRRIGYFDGQPGAVTRLLVKSINGTEDPEPLIARDAAAGMSTDGSPSRSLSKQPTDWSRDGRYFIFEEMTSKSGWDINYVDLKDERRAKPLLTRPYHERMAQLSPDGKFLAYESGENKLPQIYLTDFPGAKEKWPISTDGGSKPRWNDNGREIVYVDPSGVLRSVTLSFKGGIKASPPVKLFEYDGISTDGFNYAMSRDGGKFLIMRPSGAAPASRISVIVNWPATIARTTPR